MVEQPPQTDCGDAPRPQTFRDIAREALERLPRLCGESDLALIGTDREALVESIAEELAEKSVKHLKEGLERPEIDDIVDRTTLKRFSKAPAKVNQAARNVVGRARRPAMEEAVRRMLREEDGLPAADSHAAVSAIDRDKRRSIPEGSDRTLQDCVDALLALCRAHLSRARGEQTPWQHSIPESHAPESGRAMRDAFTRATAPAAHAALAADVVGPAIAALPTLERRVKEPQALKKQLAAEDLLNGGQDEQLMAEIRLRKHFPFGLVQGRSHVILAAALYLLQAQASDSTIRTAVQGRPHPGGPRSLCLRAREDLGAAMVRKTERAAARGWEERYPATPGALDCLRTAAPVLTQEQVPAFVGVPVAQQPSECPDPAVTLLSAALPLEEETRGDGTIAWTQAHWNPLGNRLLGKVNHEHYSLRNRRYFNETAFQHVVTRLIEHALEELLRRLQRAEGLAVGLPNTKEPYDHRSLLSLNRYLTTAWSQAAGEVFGKYRAEVEQAETLPTNAPTDARPAADAPSLPGLPDGIVLLSAESIRARLETLLTASEPYQWTSNFLADRYEINADETRTAAHGAIQVIDWAAWNEPALRGRHLAEIVEAYRADEDFGGHSLTASHAALLQDLLFDAVLSDGTTRRILSELAAITETDGTEQTTVDASEDPTR